MEDEPLSLREFIRYSDERFAESNRRFDELVEQSNRHFDETVAELRAQQRALFFILDRMEGQT